MEEPQAIDVIIKLCLQLEEESRHLNGSADSILKQYEDVEFKDLTDTDKFYIEMARCWKRIARKERDIIQFFADNLNENDLEKLNDALDKAGYTKLGFGSGDDVE